MGDVDQGPLACAPSAVRGCSARCCVEGEGCANKLTLTLNPQNPHFEGDISGHTDGDRSGGGNGGARGTTARGQL
eukprot:1560618-Prymnesium_polylepis.1